MDRQSMISDLTPIYGEREAESLIRLLFLDLFEGRQVLGVAEQLLLKASFERLMQHEPLQYVTGKAYFRDLVLHVAPGVLIPRPETEELVEHVLQFAQNRHLSHILDVGTGSGCIALALKKNLPRTKITAIDPSRTALDIARKNGESLQLDVNWVQSDFLDVEMQRQLPPPELIVSNPPYIGVEEASTLAPNVLDYEPHLALFAEPDPLIFYKEIARYAAAKGGIPVFCEINERWGKETALCFSNEGFASTLIHRDMQGKDRVVEAHFRAVI